MAHPSRPLFPLVFIGPMASGKTRIGKRVAAALKVPFVDTDKRVVAENGPIAAIFEESGEAAFRRLERSAVVDALTGATVETRESVVSLGGGAVLDPATQADLLGCTVIFLSATADAVANRIRGGKRPLLTNGTADWQRIFDERRPIYEALASIHIDTSNRAVEQIVDEIVEWVRERS
ncbi:shikimate kinase [Glaciibacter psychrotolerans]|uniref:Shikimate kinase n=1 Tax=Glaciibacter psychrotolerans TaxID=670054 RepID=A0A7Z0ECG0_9MICO|nr:shikimate kinase [Leifsonia psychrotolerans]NYJ19059.1 shikimate kinase [Leifsonia psychrotolerans]